MDAEQTSLNPSSLIDLKAELHKRHESFQRAKLIQKSDPARSKNLKFKGETIIKEKKSVPVKIKSSEEVCEEELAFKKSRLALESKARLYEKITTNNILIDDEDSERYLVDFNRKVLYGFPILPSNSGKTQDYTNNLTCSEEISPDSTFQKSREIHSEKLATSTSEKNMDEKMDTDSVHFQDVEFNEARDYGTGYFAFSMNESKRKEQMDELNSLRQQTEEQRLTAQRMQRKRKAMLEARLSKVCERRNIDKSIVQKYTSAQVEPENLNDKTQSVDLSSIPLPQAPDVPTLQKDVKVRPWDIGKTDFPAFVPEKHKLKTQNDWIEERRSERPSEFAPPSAYSGFK